MTILPQWILGSVLSEAPWNSPILLTLLRFSPMKNINELKIQSLTCKYENEVHAICIFKFFFYKPRRDNSCQVSLILKKVLQAWETDLIWVFFTFKMRGSSPLISMQRCLNSLDNICGLFCGLLNSFFFNLSYFLSYTCNFEKHFFLVKWWDHQMKCMKKPYLNVLWKKKLLY